MKAVDMNMHTGTYRPFMHGLLRPVFGGLLATVGRVGSAVTVIIALRALETKMKQNVSKMASKPNQKKNNGKLLRSATQSGLIKLISNFCLQVQKNNFRVGIIRQ